MKINYNVQGKARGKLVKIIAEALNQESTYLKAPTYNYEIGAFTITRDGELEFDIADVSKDEIQTAVDAAKAAGFEVAEIDGEPVPETETALEEDGEDSPEIAEEIEPQAEDGDSPDEESQGEDEAELGETGETENTLTISFPRASLTLNAVENLYKMIASKAPLLRKALGTELLPISDDGEELKFAWFKMGIPHDELMAYSQFITQLCKTAQAKTRVTATAPDSFDNEKFSMRVWLISLGMKGSQYALSRKLLMSKLDGNSGFRYEDKQPRNPRSGGTGEPKQVVSVRFTEDMLEKLSELAGQSNMSRNMFIESMVCEYVHSEISETAEENSAEESAE